MLICFYGGRVLVYHSKYRSFELHSKTKSVTDRKVTKSRSDTLLLTTLNNEIYILIIQLQFLNYF